MPTCCAHVVGQFSPPKTVWCQFGQFLVQNGTAAQVSEWFDQLGRAHSHASVAFCGVRGHIKSPRPLNLYAHKPLGEPLSWSRIGVRTLLFEKDQFQPVGSVNYLQTMYDKSAELYGRRSLFDLLTH